MILSECEWGLFTCTSRGIADSRARRSDLCDSSRIVRPGSPTNLNLQITVRVDLLHTTYLAQGLIRNIVTNSLVFEGCGLMATYESCVTSLFMESTAKKKDI